MWVGVLGFDAGGCGVVDKVGLSGYPEGNPEEDPEGDFLGDPERDTEGNPVGEDGKGSKESAALSMWAVEEGMGV